MNIVVAGANGLVGRLLVKHCLEQGDRVSGFDHTSMDITDKQSVNRILDTERPDVVINCAAWTDVDGCESDPHHAHLANALGPEFLALGCRRIDSQFITISTDYVFDGEKRGFYTQRDQPNPQSVYAVSKLEGERRAQNGWARTSVVRSGYIFGPGGRNFLSSFLTRAQQGEKLRVISDSVGTPTFARDLARQLHRLAVLDLPGIYHVVNSGEGASFEDFARAALEITGLNVTLETVTLGELNRPAPRPRNSRLRCLLSEAIGLKPMPFWLDSLRDFIDTQIFPKAAGAETHAI